MTGDIFFELKQFVDARQVKVLMDMEVCCKMRAANIRDFIQENKEEDTFSSRMLKYIDEKGVSDSEIYKKAGLDRRHFSKMRSRNYRPGKQTVLALCMALELSRVEIDNFLRLAGYSLSNSDTGDLVIMFCLEKKIYDIMQVNELLDYMGCRVIG